MTMKFANNATSRLFASIDALTTSIRVQAGDGAKFPAPVAPDYFTVTVEDRRTGQVEIMKCTGRSGDILNVTRAQENMSAQAFTMGATVSNRLTAGSMDYIVAAAAVGEAPQDGQKYTRRNASWYAIDPDLAAEATARTNADTTLQNNINLKANIASPVFTGDPQAPTPSLGDNDTSIATTAFVTAAISAQGLGTIYAPINNPTFTGDPKAPTPTAGDNDTSIATTAFVSAAITASNVGGPWAPIANPTFTGDPKAPTPATADNDTSIATTAYVKANVAALVGTASSGMDTLGEIEGYISANIMPTLGNKADIFSPTFTGDPKAPTPATADNDTSIATTAYVKAQGYLTDAPADGFTYGRQNNTWSKAGGGASTTSTGDKPPTALLQNGNMWFETDTGSLFIYYDDGNSQQWVQINTAARSVGGDVPSGTIVDFAGNAAPNGWLMCYGQLLSRVLYSALFAAIGTTYGAGDGSTTFNAPDCRGRVAAGKDDMGGTSANRIASIFNGDILGVTGGIEAVTLDLTMVPAHSHTGVTGNNDVNHTHTLNINSGAVSADHSHVFSSNTGGRSADHSHNVASNPPSGNYGLVASGAYFGNINSNLVNQVTSGESVDHIHYVSNSTGGISTNHTHNVNGTTASNSVNHKHPITTEGGGLAHSNMQPTIVFNKIIKV